MIQEVIGWAWIPGILGTAILSARYRLRFVASSIWKTETLAYPGVLSFVLASLLNPLTIRALLRPRGRRRGWLLVLAIYVTAALSGLAVTGLFTLVGLEVTHGRTWFEGLVDRIIRALPVTTPGAPGGQMNGM